MVSENWNLESSTNFVETRIEQTPWETLPTIIDDVRNDQCKYIYTDTKRRTLLSRGVTVPPRPKEAVVVVGEGSRVSRTRHLKNHALAGSDVLASDSFAQFELAMICLYLSNQTSHIAPKPIILTGRPRCIRWRISIDQITPIRPSMTASMLSTTGRQRHRAADCALSGGGKLAVAEVLGVDPLPHSHWHSIGARALAVIFSASTIKASQPRTTASAFPTSFPPRATRTRPAANSPCRAGSASTESTPFTQSS